MVLQNDTIRKDYSKEAKKLTLKKKSAADWAFIICNGLFMFAFVVVTLYPVLNTVAKSFNDGIDTIRGGIHLWPRFFTTKNYKEVFAKQNILTGAYISVLRTIIGTILALVTNALLAYIVSRKRFLFKSQLSLFWVITMYVNGGMIPVLLVYQTFKLTGTFWVYVIPGMISAFNVLVVRTYMQGLPESLEESAQLDGAGHMTIFLKIISPLCKPVYATVALFVAVGQWNSWFDTMLYNRTKSEYTTLQFELRKMLDEVTGFEGAPPSGAEAAQMVAQTTPQTIQAAATVITMAPIILLYPFLQKYFVTGLTIGGVKE